MRISIGDFSAMTHLSIKALRHYHDLGLLVPAVVDPAFGYRFYDPSQVPQAQAIRRFRDLGMPLEQIRSVLRAPDMAARNEVIVAHLAGMESRLSRTQAMVASLRSLLEAPPAAVAVCLRSVEAAPALAVTDRVTIAEIDAWWDSAFTELYAVLRRAGVEPAGPGGALYPVELYQQEVSDVTAFVPVRGPVPAGQRAQRYQVPPAELAIAVHKGPFGELDRTYGALGTYVAERALAVAGPIREYYLVSPADTADESQLRTEVCWPVFSTAADR